MSELKPCPFCGGTYITHEIIPVKHADVKEYYRTICKDCKCGTSMRMSEKDADSDWNRRAEPANEPLVTCGECVKYQTPNCAAKHEQALMDFCSHGIRKPGGEQE